MDKSFKIAGYIFIMNLATLLFFPGILIYEFGSIPLHLLLPELKDPSIHNLASISGLLFPIGIPPVVWIVGYYKTRLYAKHYWAILVLALYFWAVLVSGLAYWDELSAEKSRAAESTKSTIPTETALPPALSPPPTSPH